MKFNYVIATRGNKDLLYEVHLCNFHERDNDLSAKVQHIIDSRGRKDPFGMVYRIKDILKSPW